MANIIQQRLGSDGTADTSAGPSPNVWADCPIIEMIHNPGCGVYFWDDFATGGLITSPTAEAALVGAPYSGFGSTGATITNGDEIGGTIVLTEATDNEAIALKAETHPFKISANLGALWFEARVKVSTITDDAMSWVVGLMDTTAMDIGSPLSADDPPVLDACNVVGFWAPEEDAGGVNSVYIADTVTPVEPEQLVHQAVAATYVKLGMKFVPGNPRSHGKNQLYWFVNGVEQASRKTIPDDTGTDFPADVRLAPMISAKSGSGAIVMTMDWWRCAQLR